jgi:8-oxo-dGTP pyrophosphatase MutT (NUDIX family)
MKAILSCGIIPVYRSSGGPKLLILRAYRNWDFPKGVLEDGEEPLHAALRELEEETSIAEVSFSWGKTFRETEPYSGNKTARYYLAECSELRAELPISPELKRPEHHEYRWVGFAEAIALLPPRLQPILEWAQGLLGVES